MQGKCMLGVQYKLYYVGKKQNITKTIELCIGIYSVSKEFEGTGSENDQDILN